MQKLLIILATISGLFFAYVDSRPNWDDSGLEVVAILLTCGLLALFGFQRPWLLALLVGAWIPLYGLLVSHNSGSIIAMVIAFIGAYAGWGVRKVFRPAQ